MSPIKAPFIFKSVLHTHILLGTLRCPGVKEFKNKVSKTILLLRVQFFFSLIAIYFYYAALSLLRRVAELEIFQGTNLEDKLIIGDKLFNCKIRSF